MRGGTLALALALGACGDGGDSSAPERQADGQDRLQALSDRFAAAIAAGKLAFAREGERWYLHLAPGSRQRQGVGG